MERRARRWLGAAGALALAAAGCETETAAPEPSPETREVEAIAGDFLDYYEEVLHLARRYSAQPDSFRIAVGALPGSHLTEEQWRAWTEPHRQDPKRLADHLEKVIAELSAKK